MLNKLIQRDQSTLFLCRSNQLNNWAYIFQPTVFHRLPSLTPLQPRCNWSEGFPYFYEHDVDFTFSKHNPTKPNRYFHIANIELVVIRSLILQCFNMKSVSLILNVITPLTDLDIFLCLLFNLVFSYDRC